ncbi:MAG TPA: DUF664 domain-containing protein [Acidimicrobiales bacterium]|jgi:hypothetical protein|nr:DUF664 domain-containing protein [Acidimicrobiales bacterium]
METDDTETIPGGPPAAGTEVETLLGALERQRRYIAWKCGGLDTAGLQRTLPPSTMTLGGLLKHLALVEEDYFSRRLLGHEFGPHWEADWDEEPDWEWRTAADDSPEELYELWQGTVAMSRSAVASVFRSGGTLDQPSMQTWPDAACQACGA